mgnify:CR=1 FL=1
MALWLGTVDNVFWSYFNEELTTDDWDRYLAYFENFLKLCSDDAIRIIFTYNAQIPHATQRQELAEVFKRQQENTHKLIASAFITNLSTNKGANTAIDWLVKKPFLEKTFEIPVDGFAWLESTKTSFDRQRILTEIRKRVGSSIWPELAEQVRNAG